MALLSVIGLPGFAAGQTDRLPRPTVTAERPYPGEGAQGRNPDNVLDGDSSTYWAGNPADDGWKMTFDFGAVVTIPSIRVSYYTPRFIAGKTEVLVSRDAVEWEDAGTLPIDRVAALTLNRTARYLRLDMQGKSQDKQPAIAEVSFDKPVAASSTPAAAASTDGTGAAAGWPPQVTSVKYLSAADNSLQPTLFYKPEGDKPVPLLVALHTWSSDYLQPEPAYAKWCIEKGWAFIHPNFRGPNNKPEGCGSELVVQDILSAVDYARQHATIDPDRIYLVGVSGGGHAAMLLAGRAPTLWAGVSAWCGIFDLKDWYDQGQARKLPYPDMMAKACGGPPGTSAAIDEQYRRRSGSGWLENAKDVPLDLNTGIHDGHQGSVPDSQSLHAFNLLAAPTDRVADDDIVFITDNAKIPDATPPAISDPLYARGAVLMRKTSGNVRVSVFDGGHAIIYEAALGWLEQQRKGRPALWDLKPAATVNLQGQSIEAGK